MKDELPKPLTIEAPAREGCLFLQPLERPSAELAELSDRLIRKIILRDAAKALGIPEKLLSTDVVVGPSCRCVGTGSISTGLPSSSGPVTLARVGEGSISQEAQ